MFFFTILINLFVSVAVDGVHLHHNLSHERISFQIDASQEEAQMPESAELQRTPMTTSNATRVNQTPLLSRGSSPEYLLSSSCDSSVSAVSVSGRTEPRECVNDTDCWEYPKSECRFGQCTCPPDLCWHYQYFFKPPSIVYSCDTCGLLGSTCSKNADCDEPGQCHEDSFCHCPCGENDHGVCLIFQVSYEHNILTITLAMVAVMLYFILCLIAFRPDGGFFNFRICRRLPWYASEARAVERDYAAIRRARQGRGMKSQAFTHTERSRDLQSLEAD